MPERKPPPGQAGRGAALFTNDAPGHDQAGSGSAPVRQVGAPQSSVPAASPAVADRALEAQVRRWIADRVDEHVDGLAEAYGEAGMRMTPADLPPGFALTIESLIAEGLLRELDAEDFDAELRAAVREFAVLQRAEIYGDVITPTRKYLAAA